MAGSIAPGPLTAPPRGPLSIRVAREDDDADLRRLLRETPMEGRIRVALEREPDFFHAAGIGTDRHTTILARNESTGQVVAMASRSVREAFVNARAVKLGYLSQLRIDRAYRSKTRQFLKTGYDFFRDHRAGDETAFDVTTIIADNHVARRILEAGLPGLPTYRPLEPFVTFVLPVHKAGKCAAAAAVHIERGTAERFPAIADCLQRNHRRFQFASRWTIDSLADLPGLRAEDFFVALRSGRVIGCLALWDQRSFKQAVVRGYDRSLARWRSLINLAAPVLGTARLPRAGETLSQAALSHVAVDDDDPAVFERLWYAAMRDARARGLEYVTAGFVDRHPFTTSLRRFRRHEYTSLLYLVHWGAAPSLDSRLPHLEVGLL